MIAINRCIEICIAGAGSRGLAVIERILGKARLYLSHSVSFHVHIVDPGIPGIGIHATDQPDYLLLNTVSSQLSVFPDETSIQEKPYYQGPNLYEWARSNGYKVQDDGFSISKNTGREIRPDDFLPRRLLGEYLIWSYEKITSDLPPNVSLIHHRSRVVDIKKTPSNQELVELENGVHIQVDGVFLTTGHTGNVEPEKKIGA